MPPIILTLLLWLLATPLWLSAQTDPFVVQVNLTLPEPSQINLFTGPSLLTLPLVPGDRILLMPPDMAQLDPKRIVSIETDTFPAASGPAPCVSTCLIDSLFLDEGLFLSNVQVFVPYFVDGTYEGQSQVGIDALRELGPRSAIRQQDSGPAILPLTAVPANNLSMDARLMYVTGLQAVDLQGFALQAGDIEEIRLIQANSDYQTSKRLTLVDTLCHTLDWLCQAPSIDPQIPPTEAIARLQSPITVRYFEAAHATRAQALGQVLAFLFPEDAPNIYIEDMQPAYQGAVPVQDYLEIWFQ